jgi:hypothetical protein
MGTTGPAPGVDPRAEVGHAALGKQGLSAAGGSVLERVRGDECAVRSGGVAPICTR